MPLWVEDIDYHSSLREGSGRARLTYQRLNDRARSVCQPYGIIRDLVRKIEVPATSFLMPKKNALPGGGRAEG